MRSDEKCTLSRMELLDLLDTQPKDRWCVRKCGLPVCADDQSHGTVEMVAARGPSMIMAPEAWNEMRSELEQACRMLKNRCSFEMKQTIQGMANAPTP